MAVEAAIRMRMEAAVEVNHTTREGNATSSGEHRMMVWKRSSREWEDEPLGPI